MSPAPARVQAGQLRHLIQIQTRASGQNASGDLSETWTTWNTVHARVVSAAGSEPFRGQQFAPEITHVVTIRWLDGVDPTMRIVTDDGHYLDIQSVNYAERRIDDTVILTCKERLDWQPVS